MLRRLRLLKLNSDTSQRKKYLPFMYMSFYLDRIAKIKSQFFRSSRVLSHSKDTPW